MALAAASPTAAAGAAHSLVELAPLSVESRLLDVKVIRTPCGPSLFSLRRAFASSFLTGRSVGAWIFLDGKIKEMQVDYSAIIGNSRLRVRRVCVDRLEKSITRYLL